MITTEQILDWVRDHPVPDTRIRLQSGQRVPTAQRIITVCLWGETGVGKSSWIHGYCRQRHMGIRVYYPAHDRTGADIVGEAYIDSASERTQHARPTWLPGDDDEGGLLEQTGVVFVDELNRASNLVLRGLMEPLGEGEIAHSSWQMPPGWGFVCAANPPGGANDVNDLDEALLNRMLHIPMGFDSVHWAAWAGGTDIHADLISFTARYPGVVAPTSPGLPIAVLATPRTIEYLARLYVPGMDRELLRILADGLIGAVASAQFLHHVESPDRPVSAEEVLAGEDYLPRLAAHRAGEHTDLLDASETLMLAMLVRYTPTPPAAAKVARYLQALGEERFSRIWERLAALAPDWQDALAAINVKQTAAAGRTSR